jgi:hypothetical protein
MAGLGGRTAWNTSPAISTTSGFSSMTLSITRRSDVATSASR